MRIDGRKADELRPVKITRKYLKDVEGAVLIECGNTKVICTATVSEDVPPFMRNSGLGWVTAEYGMLPRSSPQRIQREAGRGKSGRTQEIQRLIGRSLRAVTDCKKLGERTVLIDCDVIQADAGTRTASITGGFIALADACRHLQTQGKLTAWPLKDYIAAVSVGLKEGEVLLDLSYAEDSQADVDMNVVMTGAELLVEVQGTGEKALFTRKQMDRLMDMAAQGIRDLINCQVEALGPDFPDPAKSTA